MIKRSRWTIWNYNLGYCSFWWNWFWKNNPGSSVFIWGWLRSWWQDYRHYRTKKSCCHSHVISCGKRVRYDCCIFFVNKEPKRELSMCESMGSSPHSSSDSKQLLALNKGKSHFKKNANFFYLCSNVYLVKTVFT